ncbi:heat shock protein 70 B2-like [Paramacrobiotus metropolitanus]|uniref:heat shock protein 70 B2-like n=1 Tax=Paramacrobiotus metropolitanus TaxID=2943436 RepID=UPI0024462AE1|nr:heat shock protein 70 B2-like [Paramacrobiotus metropolitanus]
MTVGVGIDLGTTRCCVYVRKHGCKPEVVLNADGEPITPSWIRYEQGDNEVGKFAKEQSPEHPTNTVHSAKRIIGRNFAEEAVRTEKDRMPFKIINENGSPVVQVEQLSESNEIIWRKTFRPEQISGTILAYLKTTAEHFLATDVSQAVVTVPANFTEPQRAATLSAAYLAGFSDVTLLNEPTAAAIAYGDALDQQSTILVFDFGGGTLDITIMRVEARGEYRVITTDGDMHLGGEDFDEAIVNYFLRDIEQKHGVNLTESAKARAALKIIAEDAKIALSSSKTPKYRKFAHGLLGHVKYEAVLLRETFNAMFSDMQEKILAPVNRALTAAKILAPDIDKVVLVGGSSKLPAVKEMLKRFFGKNDAICADTNPDEIVARGAAIQSYRINGGQISNIQEVTAYYYGLEVVDDTQNKDYVSRLISRGDPYPCRVTRSFGTCDNKQSEATFVIHQSRNGFDVDQFRIGEFTIDGLPPRPAGECEFYVTFYTDASNILHATAKGKGDIANYEKNIKIILDNA